MVQSIQHRGPDNQGTWVSNLKFVSPAQRHQGEEAAIFTQRIAVYQQARTKHPARWSGSIRSWSLPKEVWLNRPAVEENALGKAA